MLLALERLLLILVVFLILVLVLVLSMQKPNHMKATLDMKTCDRKKKKSFDSIALLW